MHFDLTQIHAVIGGELRGDGSVLLSRVRSLAAAGPEDLSFVRDQQFVERALNSSAGALIVPPTNATTWDRPVIVHERPNDAVIVWLEHLDSLKHPQAVVVDPRAIVASTATLARDVTVGPLAVIGERSAIGGGTWIHPAAVIGNDVVIGERCVIHPHVVLYDECQIGDDVVIHASSVIGADGFGYVQQDGKPKKVPHVGRVVIHDHVEIGANTTIDRGMLEDTVIGAMTKIDDQCHIAHNVILGEGCLLAGGTQLSGSVHAGRGVVFGGAAGIADNLVIGDFARIGGGSSLFENVPAKSSYWGYPARDAKETMRIMAATRKLPEALRELRRLKTQRTSNG
ncbi:MAG: UDP-3-O-(3-hydroxymyristoyl)glucosamine N-acyltransferase [Planctomycetes bacterium]|nr:UDP-3-O-(3-hydroxymyristoyl)glucosamine N-acyltransferase [Planctomycetota bacterium]